MLAKRSGPPKKKRRSGSSASHVVDALDEEAALEEGAEELLQRRRALAFAPEDVGGIVVRDVAPRDVAPPVSHSATQKSKVLEHLRDRVEKATADGLHKTAANLKGLSGVDKNLLPSLLALINDEGGVDGWSLSKGKKNVWELSCV